MQKSTAVGVARTVLLTEYALMRRPLGALDRHVVAPLCGSKSRLRSVYIAGLARLDALAAPADVVEAPKEPSTLPHADMRPAPRRRGPGASEVREEIERRTEELLGRQEGEVFTGELADDDLRRAQAAVEAKQEVEDELGEFDEPDESPGSGSR